MRKDNRLEECLGENITLIGTYVKPKGVTHKRMVFDNVIIADTEESIGHINIMKYDVIKTNKNINHMKFNSKFIIKGFVTKYTRLDGTEGYGLKEVILEKIN